MRSCIAFIVAFILYSHAYLYLFDAGIIPIPPGITLAAIVFLGGISWFLNISGMSTTKKNDILTRDQIKVRRLLLIWIVANFMSVALSYTLSNADEFALRSFKTFIILTAITVTSFYIFSDNKTIQAGIFGVVGALALSAFCNYFEFSGGAKLSETAGRSAGFYVNPNVSGENLVLGMVLSISYIPARFRILFCLFIGSAIILTFSRSSILTWLSCIFLFSYFKFFKINRVLTVSISAMLIFMVIFIQLGKVSLDKEMVGGLSKDASSRLVYDKKDESVKGRLSEAGRTFDAYMESPLLGHGLGSTHTLRLQPHNEYLIIAAEQGSIGLALFISLLVFIWRVRSNVARIFSIAVFLLSFFTHNLLDHPSRWLAILLAIQVMDSGRDIARLRNKMSLESPVITRHSSV